MQPPLACVQADLQPQHAYCGLAPSHNHLPHQYHPHHHQQQQQQQLTAGCCHDNTGSCHTQLTQLCSAGSTCVPAPASQCPPVSQPGRAPADLFCALTVDTSVEYEMPPSACPPPSWQPGVGGGEGAVPLLMVHPQYYEYRRHRRVQRGLCRCQLCQFYGGAQCTQAPASSAVFKVPRSTTTATTARLQPTQQQQQQQQQHSLGQSVAGSSQASSVICDIPAVLTSRKRARSDACAVSSSSLTTMWPQFSSVSMKGVHHPPCAATDQQAQWKRLKMAPGGATMQACHPYISYGVM